MRGFGRFGRGSRGEPPWAHDTPRAERNFARILGEVSYVDPYQGGIAIELDDPELFRYPIAYIVEVGFWSPTEQEIRGLGDFLTKGGFLIVDDFRGERELNNFDLHLRRALPWAQLLPVEDHHEIFDSFFRIENPEDLTPPYGGYPPIYLGVFEDNDPSKRLLVILNYNNDHAEYWEFSDLGYYPIDLSNDAYKFGVNYIVYAMTH